MSFTQGAPTQPLSILASNVFVTGSSAAGNAFTVQQLGVGNVFSAQTSTGATALIINPSGNVGIGTTSPSYNLEIQSSNFPGIRCYNTASGSGKGTGLFLQDQNTALNLVTNGPDNTVYFEVGAALSSDSRANVNFTSMYSATSFMYIKGSNGYVGIGTTTNLNCPLTIYNSASTSTYTGTTAWGNLHLMPNGANNSWAGITFGGSSSGTIQQSTQASITVDSNSSSGTTMRFNVGYLFANGALERMTIIGQTGNVGINTASPKTTLDVNGSMNAQNFAQPTFTNQQYTTITTATSMAAASLGGAGGITITKTASGTNTWDACAYSNQSYKYGAYCSARASQTNQYVMWGLSTNQTSALGPSAYVQIDYAWYFVADGTLSIFEFGTGVGGFGNYYVTTTCSITYDGFNITYWKDGVAVRVVARAVGLPLYFMCTPWASGGSSINNVIFGEKGNTTNPGQVITASTGMFSNTVISSKTGALHSTGESPGAHALMAFAPDGATTNSSIWMGFDPTNDCGYINCARSGQVRPVVIQTRGGNVGIGLTNPTSYTLQVSGTIGASGDITALYSDERLKTKTGTLENALDKVCSLDAFTYKNNDLAKSFGFKDDLQRVGVSAQQVQKVLPEAVRPAPFDAENQSGENYLTVQYEKLVPLLIESLKEERHLRCQLEERVVALESAFALVGKATTNLV